MASGCPVINTEIPGSGVSWVSQHQKTGLTIPINDPDALAKAANTLLQDRDLRDRLGAAGQSRVRSEFDISTMLAATSDCYEAILNPEKLRQAG